MLGKRRRAYAGRPGFGEVVQYSGRVAKAIARDFAPSSRVRQAGVAAAAAAAAFAASRNSRLSLTRPRARRRPRKGGCKNMTVKKLCKKVDAIGKGLKNTVGTYIKINYATSRPTTAINKSGFTILGELQASYLDGIISALEVFNPSVPATPIVANYSSGGQSKQTMIKSVKHEYNLVNNYQIPVKVQYWIVRNKTNTGDSPITDITAGLVDTGNVLAIDSLPTMPYHSNHFKNQWRVAKSGTKLLNPGQNMQLNYQVGNIAFDPSHYDSATFAYMDIYKTFAVMIKLTSAIGHDSTATPLPCYPASALDCMRKITYKVEYDAGVDWIKYDYSETSLGASGSTFVCLKPQGDLFSFSNT